MKTITTYEIWRREHGSSSWSFYASREIEAEARLLLAESQDAFPQHQVKLEKVTETRELLK